jgi:hypothetical protein
METILEAVDALPTQTQGKKRGLPNKNANGKFLEKMSLLFKFYVVAYE